MTTSTTDMNNSTPSTETANFLSMTTKEKINHLALTLSISLLTEWSTFSDELAIKLVNTAIDIAIEGQFENRNAEINVRGLVQLRIAKVSPNAYAVMHTPMRMDQNGNYTADSSKWA